MAVCPASVTRRRCERISESANRVNEIMSVQLPDSSTAWEPSYLRLHRSGELAGAGPRAALDSAPKAATSARAPAGWMSQADGHGRVRGRIERVIAAWNVHMWEEPPITGSPRVGYDLLLRLTGKCIFCQN